LKLPRHLPKDLCGVSGEYFVASVLSQLGYIASLTLKNTRGIDILASNVKASRLVGIQVKTNQDSKLKWILNAKAEGFVADTLFYVFVNLKCSKERPDFFVVPSQTVADHIINDHRKWLGSLGKNGRPHNDSQIRKFSDESRQYLERWDLLGL
jgi:hypothetical protein